MSPRKHRIVAIMYFGVHVEVFNDDGANHLLSMKKTDFKLEGEVKNFRTFLSPPEP